MTLGFFGIVVFLGAVALLCGLAAPGSRQRLVSSIRGQERHPVAWAALLATTAMISSLYLSDVVGLIPCNLCWYQRFMMYPLALILIGAAVTDRPGVWRVGLPLSVIGLAIAIYHVTIQWMPTLDVGACSSGAPCTGRYVAVFGFISIPTMAGAIFTAVAALMLLLWMSERAQGLDSASSTTEATPGTAL